MNLEQLLDVLGYANSRNYRSIVGNHEALTAHLFRSAQSAGVQGAYLFHTSPDDQMLPPRPAVYVAEATTEGEAREIHRSLWNLGNAPFLIIVLPHQIRVYTGFDYAGGVDQSHGERGLISIVDTLQTVDWDDALSDYTADSIDSGRLWKNKASYLLPERRVDARLLKNLKHLEAELLQTDLELRTSHALIGKYVYIRYLCDRKILSEQWLDENKVDIKSVLGRRAKLSGLRQLVDALDERFNGHIFPFPLDGKHAPTDDHISLVASAFKGDDPKLRQMHLDFEAFDFSYIPVETLSSIYEQFLQAEGVGKTVGAIYTPEPLADYLIAELNSAKPLLPGMKVLDPCCGSGIFLVLAYRKLIELELNKRVDHKLRPAELRQILTESIYGVERNPDACFVTELSLILTMLHYISPPDLHRNKQFHFPNLHNSQIFEADFFDDSSLFWERKSKFDWIIGNPPWIEPENDSLEEQLAISWITDKNNVRHRPVAGNRVAEAFSWRVTDLTDTGFIGLIMPAASLFNHESRTYRQEFFKLQQVQRITNFTNLRFVLFAGRGLSPAATFIYSKAVSTDPKPDIVHYGPFVVNQALSRLVNGSRKQDSWVITINENEIQTVSPSEAELGNAVTWKLALWGTHRDKRALERLRSFLPSTLDELGRQRGWIFNEGVRLVEPNPDREKGKYELEAAPELEGRMYFDASIMSKSGHRFSIPDQAFQKIPVHLCFIRTRSGKASLTVPEGAHLLLNSAYFAFTDRDFIIRAPHKRLSAPMGDADYLRALSLFLSSSIVQYYLFFLSPAWGIERDRIYVKDIKRIPIPDLSDRQIREMAELHREIARQESAQRLVNNDLQQLVDEQVARIVGVPPNLSILAIDFMRVRLSLNQGQTQEASRAPREHELFDYAELLRNELDAFTKGHIHHRVSVTTSRDDLVICTVEVTSTEKSLPVSLELGSRQLTATVANISRMLHQQFSQWVYVRRGLRIFDDSKVHICKTARVIDWTRTQALNDSDDIIAEVLSRRDHEHEVAMNGAR
ncbi:MAG TPA: N-6 DNA methylase [Pyrinomonadaceae bacterium]